MKRLAFIIMFISVVSFGIAQTNQQDTTGKEEKQVNSYKPTKNDLGFTFNLTGLINNLALQPMVDVNGNSAILFRTYYKNDMAFRLGFGFNYWNLKRNKIDSVGASLVKWDSTYKKVNVFLAPGLEKHFETSSRLDPYLGATLNIGILGKTKLSTNKETTDTTGTAKVETNADWDGGFSLGMDFVAGFNYYFSEKLALGTECVFGFYSKLNGGDWEIITITTPIGGSPSSNRKIGSDVISSKGFSVNSTINITLSYFFSRNKKKK